jgi:hypothetical protein
VKSQSWAIYDVSRIDAGSGDRGSRRSQQRRRRRRRRRKLFGGGGDVTTSAVAGGGVQARTALLPPCP